MSTTTFYVDEWDSWHWEPIGDLTVQSEDVHWYNARPHDGVSLLAVDLPDGEFLDGSRRVQRINFDAINVSLIFGPSHPEIIGYANVETFDDGKQTPLWDGYRKMRWRVR